MEAALAPGASVALVARENGVNANQVHTWRRLYEGGQLGAAAAPGALVAVRVAAERRSRERAAAAGGLELELERARLRIEPGADGALLRIVLEHLLG